MTKRKSAFTLIELLVVVAIIALLISILLPSLSQAREQGKKAVCLSNLRFIGVGIFTYANEDPAEQIIPIHEYMVRALPSSNTGAVGQTRWIWRQVNWFAWGGATATEEYYANGRGEPEVGSLIGQERNLSGQVHRALTRWGASNRPLNNYLYQDLAENPRAEIYETDLRLYACPGDKGYPKSEDIDDAPWGQAGRECYATLGNSYRGSLITRMAASGNNWSGAFSYGPWGQKVADIAVPGRTVLLGEPTFFNMIGSDDPLAQSATDVDGKDALLFTGWHQQLLRDNLLFCDGSAATVKAEGSKPLAWGIEEFVDDLIDPDFALLASRGATYQLDNFPNPGALIWGPPSQLVPNDANRQTKWPWRNFRTNLIGG